MKPLARTKKGPGLFCAKHPSGRSGKTNQVPFSLLLLLAAAGCGESLPPTVSVEGKVTWQGEPLTDGTVMFHPISIPEGSPRRPATCELGPNGTYRLSTFRRQDGVVPGRYAAVIHSYTSQPTLENPDAPWIWRIPERYGDPERSGFEVTIPADAEGKLVFDFELTE